MPQFDQVIFLNQIFWNFLIFFLFYCGILLMYLPDFYRALKTRYVCIHDPKATYHLDTRLREKYAFPLKKKRWDQLYRIKLGHRDVSSGYTFPNFNREYRLINLFHKAAQKVNFNQQQLNSENKIKKFFFSYLNLLVIQTYFLKISKK